MRYGNPVKRLVSQATDAIRVNEMHVAESVISATSQADDPPGCEKDVRDHLDERARRQAQPHARDAADIDASDDIARGQPPIAHRHDINAMASRGQTSRDPHDDLGPRRRQEGETRRKT